MSALRIDRSAIGKGEGWREGWREGGREFKMYQFCAIVLLPMGFRGFLYLLDCRIVDRDERFFRFWRSRPMVEEVWRLVRFSVGLLVLPRRNRSPVDFVGQRVEMEDEPEILDR